MRTRGKQWGCVFLLFMWMLLFTANGYAAGNTEADNTLTIHSDSSNHSYQLYQIFGGDVDTDSEGKTVLTNVIWGDGIDADEFVSILQEDSELSGYFIEADSSVPDSVAEALADLATDADLVRRFAGKVNECLTGVYNEPDPEQTQKEEEEYSYTFVGLYDGYYLLKDEIDSLTDSEDPSSEDAEDTAAYTLYILEIVGGDVDVHAKTDRPTIEKYIVDPDDADLEKTEEYSIGDPIIYQLNSAVPDMAYYSGYWFVVQDILSPGLTFDEIMSIYVGDTEVMDEEIADSDYDFTYSLAIDTVKVTDVDGTEADATKVTIVFHNFYENYADCVEEAIQIRYMAHLNQDCRVGVTGNDNCVYLIYSNNPNLDYSGEWSEEKDGMGRTTNKTTISYTAKIRVVKVDEDDQSLSDAVFSLSSDQTKFYTWSKTETYNYVLDEAGDYYKIGEDQFEIYDESNPAHSDPSGRYRRVESEINYILTTDSSIQASGDGTVTGTTGNDGYVTFTGLGEGTYTLTEIDAPEGYNILEEPITIEIQFSDPEWETKQPNVNKDTAVWTYTVDGGERKTATEDGTIVVTVINTPGVLLPSTGGVGTVVFTLLGVGVMAVTVMILYVRRHRDNE
ncbi:MAG: isopeptide-forming domain-containing fimbrial protein [Clostridiales bacterium]|nr:isopeptide-forming domain-containing fimbrial protein [Clostridiales bacterium]